MIRKIQELLHPNGFFAALWPYRFSAMTFGHCNAASKLRRAIYAIFIVSVSFIHSYSISYNSYESIIRERGSDVQLVMTYFTFWLEVIVVPINVSAWFFVGHSCYMKVVASLMLLDRELAQLCSKHVNLKKMVIRQIVSILLPVSLAILLVVGELLRESQVLSLRYILEMISCYYSRTIGLVLMYSFGNLVHFTGSRYALVNCSLKGIASSEKFESARNLSTKIFDDVTLARRLRVIHRKLFFVSRKIMDAFEIQALIFVLYNSSETVYTFYAQYKIGALSSDKWVHRIFMCIIAILYDFGGLIYVAYCCHRTAREANGTTKILNSLTTGNEDLRLEVSSFSHQLMHYQLHFSPLGFFKLNLGLVQSIVASITTYLIILIQMDSTVHSGNVKNTTRTS